MPFSHGQLEVQKLRSTSGAARSEGGLKTGLGNGKPAAIFALRTSAQFGLGGSNRYNSATTCCHFASSAWTGHMANPATAITATLFPQSMKDRL